ncbi:hypothetical protein O6P43_017882 [Quillaja saponaria]|uniref:Uncharacterized protein n=1 Tax=Quillaja saponaria TaxID=32244 RepID=A0AAD7LQV8_QUISA|nr:hypothetical protein O6P43_017882 [Quillaja saponaria]
MSMMGMRMGGGSWSGMGMGMGMGSSSSTMGLAGGVRRGSFGGGMMSSGDGNLMGGDGWGSEWTTHHPVGVGGESSVLMMGSPGPTMMIGEPEAASWGGMRRIRSNTVPFHHEELNMCGGHGGGQVQNWSGGFNRFNPHLPIHHQPHQYPYGHHADSQRDESENEEDDDESDDDSMNMHPSYGRNQVMIPKSIPTSNNNTSNRTNFDNSGKQAQAGRINQIGKVQGKANNSIFNIHINRHDPNQKST